ncbi:LysR family transcriptional regulator [Paenibacillus sp. ACRRX]|uniref:LysR family transcriptional regulator n=1 Tax=Paenibacillus sp. ACRRX TaxID=2918206 RepID=UPI001EF59553|nr:LysR family transcriptional regulator [Paenibacillus sp. ACRRX]MCG7409207.1 LysR family transcriptional regulator [Paenibacillus sp. ACRRX]
MDLKSLNTFHKIVSLGGFNRAAEELNYAQSTVTMQMQKLEAELGVQLIERGRIFQLTEAGRLFHEQSAHIVRDVEHLQANMSDMLLGEAGSIRLGAVEPIASYQLPDILYSFLETYPRIKLSVDIANSPVLAERILKGELDMAICSAPAIGSDLYFEPIFTENLVYLIPEDHPLAAQTSISFGDIRNHRILLTSKTCSYRQRIELALREMCGHQVDTLDISSMSALKSYVESGLGIALVPESMAKADGSRSVTRKMNDYPITVPFGILCKTADYPLKLACAKLRYHLKQAFDNRHSNSS